MSNKRGRQESSEKQRRNAYREKIEGLHFSHSLEKNVALIKELFCDVDIMKYRVIEGQRSYCLIWSEGLVSSEQMDAYIIKPLLLFMPPEQGGPILDVLRHHVLQVNEIKKTGDLFEIVKAVAYGETLLITDGETEGLLLDTKSFTTRSINEPDAEKILSGPREGFSESLMQNLSLVRRKLRTSELKLKMRSMGQRSNTQICVAYLDGIVKTEVLDELNRRLDAIEIDAVLDTNYLNELIKDNKHSLFRSTAYTERPDVVVSKILEGRVAIFVDGSPVALTAPYLFMENFQSSEDYYVNYYYASLSRLLRFISFFVAITVPGLFVAILSYHQEMLPTVLLIRVAVDSRNVPFPTIIETFALLIMFDILREAGARMPTGVGQALSIVGALVVGSAAVEADLVSANVIIIAAASGITSLLATRLNAAIPIIRNFLIILAAVTGFYGLVLGISVLFIHILRLESFGVPQIGWDTTLRYQNIKDTVIRGPMWRMSERPNGLTEDKVRLRTRRGGKQ
ncbi:MAG: spore germination protein [Oscillospiraceae bacterium]|nr:spore germination protein [Oscillospiraceae bacterium]